MKDNMTRYAILGLIRHEPLSGYDIKKRAGGGLGFFWSAGFGQIYPTLRRLEEEGLVTKKTAAGKNADRILHSISKKGIQELEKWLKLPAEKETIKSEFVLKLFFSGGLGTEQNLMAVADIRKNGEEKLAILEGYENSLRAELAKSAGHSGGNDDHLNFLLAVLYGKALYAASLKWAKEAESMLRAASPPGRGRAKNKSRGA